MTISSERLLKMLAMCEDDIANHLADFDEAPHADPVGEFNPYAIRELITELLASRSGVGCRRTDSDRLLTDDEIMEVIKEVAPRKSEPRLYDLLTYEKSPPLFPQATYDVPTAQATALVRAVEKRVVGAVIEECANIADTYIGGEYEAQGRAAEEIAADIRTLKDNTHGA